MKIAICRRSTFTGLLTLLLTVVFSRGVFSYDAQPLHFEVKRLYGYLGSAVAVIVVTSAIAIYIYRVNRRLAEIMKENSRNTSALAESEALWRTIIKTSPDGITITSMDGTVRQVSDKLLTMFGYSSAEEVIGRNMFEFIDQAYHEKAANRVAEMLNGNYVGADDYQVIRKDGTRFYIEANAEILRDGDGNPRELFFIDRDITERKRVEAVLRSLSVAVEQSPVSVVIADLNAIIQYVNPRFTDVTGYSAEEVIGQNPSVLNSGFTEPSVFEELWSALKEGRTWKGEFINRKKNGEIFWEEAHIAPVYDSVGVVNRYVAVKLDISDRKQIEEKVTHLAQHDSLTDLPNRALFADRLHQALVLAHRDGVRMVIMFVDLDHFKPVNDTYGHAVGDLLLREVAQRMREAVRSSDTVGRIGGDEFVVLLPRMENVTAALVVAEKLRCTLAEPFELAGHILKISSSIGIAIYPDHGGDDRELTQRADAAMYCAKQEGRNRVEIFRPEMLELN